MMTRSNINFTIGRALVTENVIYFLSEVGEAIDFISPKTRKEWRERDLTSYYRNRARLKAEEKRECRRVRQSP